MAIYCPQCATIELSVAGRASGRLVRCDAAARRGWRGNRRGPYRRRSRRGRFGTPAEVSDAIVIEHVGAADQAARDNAGRRPEAGRRSTGFDLSRSAAARRAFGGAARDWRCSACRSSRRCRNVTGLPADVDQLEFQNVRSETVENRGAVRIVVEGEIVNRSGATMSPCRPSASRSVAPTATEVRSWLVEPTADGLAAGQLDRLS